MNAIRNATRGQRGMSLVEATIILLVLMLLTGVIAPSITEFVNDAKRVKVKEDCEALGLVTAYWKAAVNCLQFSAASAAGGCSLANRIDILYSDDGPNIGSDDLDDEAETPYDTPSGNGDAVADSINWDEHLTAGAPFSDVFTENSPEYGAPVFSSPRTVKPWPPTPPQIQSPVMSDPWGHKYLVNSLFLSVANNASVGTTEGDRSGAWLRKVFCLSAGPNGRYQTHFSGTLNGNRRCGVDRIGDDYFYPIGCVNQ